MGKLYKYIIGYTDIEVVCGDIGKFITECAKSRIHIWNINRKDKITLTFKAYNYQLDDVISVADRFNAEIDILATNGLIKKIRIILGRKFFITGFLLFLLIMLISTSFVTDIEVLGNEKLTKQQVIDMLSQTGFRKGMLIYNIDKKLIQQEMIKNFDEFSWIWIDLNGTRANVTIKERVPVPEISDNTDYSNCVASSDGVIVEVMPRYGKQIVFPGDVVKRGDLLISGISETKADDIRYLHADGIVMAKTWYSISGEYNHTRIDRHLTGEYKKRYNLNILGFSLPLSKTNVDYEKYDKETHVKNIADFLNLSFTISTYYEIIENDVTIDDSEVINSAVEVLTNNLKSQLESKKDLSIQNITHNYSINDLGNINVTVQFECIEDIAQYKQLNKPESYTEDTNGKNDNV